MDKWYYIQLISKLSDKYGDKLVEMMNYYNKNNLREVTLAEVKEFYKKIK